MTSGILILFGVAGWMIFFAARRKIQAMETWPTTPAIIAESRVEKMYRASNWSSGPRVPMYSPVIQYAYHVGGTDYRNFGISPVGTTGSRNSDAAQQTVDRYPPGRECLVMYNPERPQEAYLETSNANDARLFAILGTISIGVGLLLIGRV